MRSLHDRLVGGPRRGAAVAAKVGLERLLCQMNCARPAGRCRSWAGRRRLGVEEADEISSTLALVPGPEASNRAG